MSPLTKLRSERDQSALLVSTHDDRLCIQPLLYQSAWQHRPDGVFVLLGESHDDRARSCSKTSSASSGA